MIGYLLPVLFVGVLAVFLFLRGREIVRSIRPQDEEEHKEHGILLSTHTNPAGNYLGRPMLSAQFKKDSGETVLLELKSRPLLVALVPGTAGTAVCRGGVMLDFLGDQTTEPNNKECIDMSQQKLLKNGELWGVGIRDILVQGESILAVGTDLCAGPDAEVIDLTGKTVLPGFFNAHVHLYGVEGPLPDGVCPYAYQPAYRRGYCGSCGIGHGIQYHRIYL